MNNYKKYIIFIIYNILPFTFLAITNQKISVAIITFYSIIALIINVIIYNSSKLYKYQYMTIPFGSIVLSFTDRYRANLCEDNMYLIVVSFISLLVVLISYIFGKKHMKFFDVIILYICLIVVISGQMLSINEAYDDSKPTIVEAIVTEKIANGNWFNDYSFSYFEVKTNDFGYLNVNVSKPIYIYSDIGDQIKLCVRNGYLGIKYCYIIDENIDNKLNMGRYRVDDVKL